MTTLDGNAIAEVERLVRSAETIVVPDQEPAGVYYVRRPDGTLERHRATLDAHPTTVRDLASLEAAITDACRMEEARGVFVDDDSVTLIQQNEGDSWRWRTALPLPIHPAFTLVSAWQRGTLLTQKELVRTLRTQLSLYVDATVIPTFSALNFTDSREGASTVAPMSNAIDKRISQRVSSANGQAVPEYILLTPPVYDIPEDRGEEYHIKVYVEFDHDEKKFLLQTVHDDLRRARERAVERVISRLRAHVAGLKGDLTVLYGTPK